MGSDYNIDSNFSYGMKNDILQGMKEAAEGKGISLDKGTQIYADKGFLSNANIYKIYKDSITGNNSFSFKENIDLFNLTISVKNKTSTENSKKNILDYLINLIWIFILGQDPDPDSINELNEMLELINKNLEEIFVNDPSRILYLGKKTTKELNLDLIQSKNFKLFQYLIDFVDPMLQFEPDETVKSWIDPEKNPLTYDLIMGKRAARQIIEEANLSHHFQEIDIIVIYEPLIKEMLAKLKLENNELAICFFLRDVFLSEPKLIEKFLDEIKHPKMQEAILNKVYEGNPEKTVEVIQLIIDSIEPTDNKSNEKKRFYEEMLDNWESINSDTEEHDTKQNYLRV